MVRVGCNVKSDVARPINGLRFRPSKVTPAVCCACTAAAACLTKDDADIDFCSMTSDILRFFKIGFLWRNEFDLDSRLEGSEAWEEIV